MRLDVASTIVVVAWPGSQRSSVGDEDGGGQCMEVDDDVVLAGELECALHEWATGRATKKMTRLARQTGEPGYDGRPRRRRGSTDPMASTATGHGRLRGGTGKVHPLTSNTEEV